MKPLLKKMAYQRLVSEAKRKSWTIPKESDFIGKELDYSIVWISDEVPDSEYCAEDKVYGVKLGYVFDVELQRKIIANQNFIMNCIIIKDVK